MPVNLYQNLTPPAIYFVSTFAYRCPLIPHLLHPGARFQNKSQIHHSLNLATMQSAEQMLSVNTSLFYLFSLLAGIWLVAHRVLFLLRDRSRDVSITDILLYVSGSCISHCLLLWPYLARPIFFLPDNLFNGSSFSKLRNLTFLAISHVAWF